jgi:plastocyanin
MKTLRIWTLLTVGLILLLPGVVLAGGGGGGAICAGFATDSTVVMRDNCFEGTAHFAEAGTTITIRNEGHLPHSFTAVDGSFDTGLLDGGQRAEIELEGAAIVQVYCTLHGTAQGSGMAGILVVGDPAPTTGTGDSARTLQTAFTSHDETQSESLAVLEAEIAALRQTVSESSTRRVIDLALTSVPGLLGALLGSVALAITIRSGRSRRSLEG